MLKPAKCDNRLNKPEKANGKKSLHELCRFVFSRSGQKHTIFPLSGTNEQFCGKIVEKSTRKEGDIHEAVRTKYTQERTFL